MNILLSVVLLMMLLFSNCRNKDEATDIVFFNPSVSYGSLTDQEGNQYKTVEIGSQTWMAENLKTTRYRNNDSIRNIVAGTEWDTTQKGGYCNYNNNPDFARFGRIYNWHAVTDSRNVCPAGWHIPTDPEWSELINYLGEENAGGKLKEAGYAHWNDPNAGADNSSGFTALPVGARYEQDLFFGIGASTGWWSSTENDTSTAWHCSLSSNYGKVGRYISSKNFGISVRCVKD